MHVLKITICVQDQPGAIAVMYFAPRSPLEALEGLPGAAPTSRGVTNTSSSTPNASLRQHPTTSSLTDGRYSFFITGNGVGHIQSSQHQWYSGEQPPITSAILRHPKQEQQTCLKICPQQRRVTTSFAPNGTPNRYFRQSSDKPHSER